MTTLRSLFAALLALLALALSACPAADQPGLAPMADAGADQVTVVGETVVLDGSGSQHPDGRPLTFNWYLVSAPEGSAAEIEDEARATARLTPDLAGDYDVGLRVDDGRRSDTAHVAVVAVPENRPPLAAAGADQTVSLGTSVTLDGTGSSDPDGDELQFEWGFVTRPEGSDATLSAADTATPSFLADALGAFVVRLEVSDSALADVDECVVTVVPTLGDGPPVADAGPDRTAYLGDTVHLDGRGSSGGVGPVTYEWVMLQRPPGSDASLIGSDTATASFVADIEGVFGFRLTVADDTESDSDEVEITVVPYSPAGTIHVAPDGDDAARGSADAPLRTLAAAVAMADAYPEVRRIRLAAGDYHHDSEHEPYAYSITRELDVEGASEDEVTLHGTDEPFFRVEGGASLFILRMTLRQVTEGVALEAAADSELIAAELRCEATTCVQADDPAGGATVSLSDVTLVGPDAATSGSRGIVARDGTLLVRDASVTGYQVGLDLNPNESAVLLTRLQVADNDVGLFAAGSEPCELIGGSFETNRVGIVLDGARVNATGTTLSENLEYGIRADGGSVAVLQDVTIAGNGLGGVNAAGTSSLTLTGGEVTGNGRRLRAPFFERAGVRASDDAFVLADATVFRENAAHVVSRGDSVVRLLGTRLESALAPGLLGEDTPGVAIDIAAPGGLLRLEGGVVTANGRGVHLTDGRAEIRGVHMHANSSGGVRVIGGRLLMRDSTLDNAAYNLEVAGSPGAVDLGRAGDPGENHLHVFYAPSLSVTYGINDVRPARDDADGPLLDAHGTTCWWPMLPGPGSWELRLDDGSVHVGPASSGNNGCWRIAYANNRMRF